MLEASFTVASGYMPFCGLMLRNEGSVAGCLRGWLLAGGLE